jgi:hypothetical protein
MTQIQTQKGLADTVRTALQTGISRRKALGASLGVAAGLGTVTTGAHRAQAATQTPLTAVITLGGTTYTFNETDGQDLGNFVSDIGGFTQRCVRTNVSGLPISVFFRPDLNSDRVEVVFEYGRIFYTGTPVNLGAYTVAISRGSQTLATVNVPNHYWFSRWRWQSSPRPVVADVAALISQKLLPPYDRSLVPAPAPAATLPANYYQMPTGEYLDTSILQEIEANNYANVSKLVVPTTTINAILHPATVAAAPVSSGPAQVYTIMGLAGVMAAMPTTGERQDIGLVTEYQAQYICTADSNALDTVRAQGEAAGTVPWHMRDENTNAPINFQTYPKAAWYTGQPGNGTPYVQTVKTPITVDDAHQPALSYVPYLLTGDPYYLEELQFQATWNYGSFSVGYRPTLSQPRQFAWSMRTLGQCAKVTPANVPSWLLPPTYWASMLTAHRVFFETNYVNNPALCKSLFRATDNLDNRPQDMAPAGTWCEQWQHDFIACVFGWLVQMGFTEWRTSFDWQIGSTIARTSTTSGWVRAYSTPYETPLRASKTAPYAQSWAEAWNLTQTLENLTYTDANTWMYPDMTYLTYTRGALVYAQQLGAVLTDNLTWATGQLKAKKWNTYYKWRLGTGLS